MKDHRIKISPSMMCADFMDLRSELDLFRSKHIDYLHIDVMDGHYVPNLTLGFDFAKSLHEYSGIPLDFHLMVEKPENFLDIFCQVENSVVSIHPDATWHPDRLLRKIRESGCSPGIVINPHMAIDQFKNLYPIVDVVLVMTVNPGYAGQKLVPQSLDKIHELKSYAEINNLAFDIEVDGNVSWENIPAMVMAGASVLVAGTSSLFQPGQKREDSLERLFQLIDKL